MTASLPLDLDALFALQRQAFVAQSFPPEVVRRDRLDRLQRLVEEHEHQIAEAICADFGNRSHHGEYGFRIFSKEKPVFEQSRLAGTWLLRPPYGKLADSVIRTLRRLL